jgi:hypothetical protein
MQKRVYEYMENKIFEEVAVMDYIKNNFIPKGRN